MCTAAGTALTYLFIDVQAASPIRQASQLLLAPSSLFIILWGKRLCDLSITRVLQGLALSELLSFLITLGLSALPSAVTAAIHPILPMISGLLFTMSCSSRPLERAKGALHSATASRKAIPWRAFVGIGCFESVILFSHAFSESKTTQPDELLWIVSGLFVCFVVLFATIVGKQEAKASSLSRLMLPLLAVEVFLIFAYDFGQISLEVFALGCAWKFFYIFSFVIWRAGVLASDLPAVSVLAIGKLIASFGSLLGNGLYAADVALHVPQLGTIAFICVFSIVISMFLLDTKHVSDLADPTDELFDPRNPAHCERCADELTSRFGLSGQERTISLMIVQGMDNQAIRSELVIADSTLRTHLKNMYRKTGVHGREELMIFMRSFMSTGSSRSR